MVSMWVLICHNLLAAVLTLPVFRREIGSAPVRVRFHASGHGCPPMVQSELETKQCCLLYSHPIHSNWAKYERTRPNDSPA